MDRLTTKRLTLRPVEERDRAPVVAGVGDLAVSRWLSKVPHPYTDADFDVFLSDIAKPGETFVIEDALGFAGIVGAGEELGYWLMPRAHGLGYATEAARAVMAQQFAETPADVYAGYFVGNDRSAAVLRKLGCVETGLNEVFCTALGAARAHVITTLTRAAFVAALPIEATSARLTYRSLYPTDAMALHEVVRHWEVTQMLGPKWPWPADPAFTATRARPYGGDGFAWGVFRGGALIGTVGVTEGELGYSLRPDHHRQGLMFEACTTALTRAFGEMALPSVTASVWADNAGSLALLRKLGFAVTGENTDTSHARPETSPGYDLRLTAGDWLAA